MSNTQIRVLIDAKGTVSGLDTVSNGLKLVQKQAALTQQEITKAYKINFNASSFNAVSKSVLKTTQDLNKLSPAFQKIKTDGIDAGKKLSTAFNSNSGLSGLAKTVGNVGSAFTAVQTIIGGGIIGAAVIRGISACVDEAVKLENALVGVESVARSFGHDTDEVKKAVLDFTKDGLVPASDAALAFKQILATGTDLPTAIKLMNSLKDAAALNRQSFYTLGEAIVATTEGIKNGTSARADAVGITKNLSNMDNEYAASIGKTAGALSDAEKYQARVNGFIKEGAVYAGDAAKVLDTYTGSASRLGTSFDRLLAGMGSFITKSEGLKSAMSGLASVFDYISAVINKTPLEKLKARYIELGEQVKNESGFYKQYALDNQAAVKKQIDAIESQIVKKKEESQVQQEAAKKKIADNKAVEANLKSAAEATKERTKQIKVLDNALKAAGMSELDYLKKVREERLKLVGPQDTERRFKIEDDFAKKVRELNKKTHDEQVKQSTELAALRKRLISDAITSGASNPFEAPDMPQGLTPAEQEKYKRNNNVGRVAGGLNFVAGGADGAKQLISSAAAGALDAWVPGLGKAVKPLIDAFTQGPEAVKGMVNQFADALPDVIQGFIEAIPVFIQTLVERAPDIIERLADKAPDIINKLAEAAPVIIVKLIEAVPKIITSLVAHAPQIIFALVTAMPKVAIKFATELIKNVPRIVTEAAVALYNAIVDMFNQIMPATSGNGFFSGSSDNGFMGTGIHYATGGEVPKNIGTPFKDSVPATLMPGERMLDLETNRAFKEQVKNGGSNATVEALLVKVVALLEQPMQVTSETKLNNSVLAQALLQLSRTQQRIS